MIRRLMNKCTTAVTIVLDGKDVTIPAGALSPEYKKAKFSFADQRLINSCLLVPIESRPKMPMVKADDLRQPSPKTVVDSHASDRTTEEPTNKKTKSKTDK